MSQEKKLFDAARRHEVGTITSLLDNEVNMYFQNDHQENVLHKAVKGLDKDKMGETNTLDTVKLLLENGADKFIDQQDENGNTALHNAVTAYKGKLQTVKLLVKWGADLNIENNDGQKPIDLAKSAAVALDLIENNKESHPDAWSEWWGEVEEENVRTADLYIKDQNGRSAVHCAVEIGNVG